MAFQRPFLISLKRSDSSQKWGFGIKGGKEYGEPLVIQTVAEDSLAERCGLRQGDEVIQVGRVNVQDLPLGQVYELLARCGNKIEMFVVREDLLSPRKGKEPPVVKAVVHNPYNSPLSLYSTENIADTLAKQTEVLTEGQISAEEDEGPENLSFKEKSAVFKLLSEQAGQESAPKAYSRGATQNTIVNKPKVAPPPPPKPKAPPEEHVYNGYESHQQLYQDQQKVSNRIEYQTTKTSQKVLNQYQYQQEQPVQYQQSTVYQVSSQPRSPGYHSPSVDHYQSPGYHSPVNQQYPSYQSPANYQQQVSYQQSQQINYQHSPPVNYQQNQQSYYQQGPNYHITTKSVNQDSGYKSPTPAAYQQVNQSNFQQNSAQSIREQKQPSQLQFQQQQRQQSQQEVYQTNQQQSQQVHQANQQQHYQQQQKISHQQKVSQQQPTSVSKTEFKIRPAPPPRNTSVNSIKQNSENMTAVYRQQYEQHLQQQQELQNMHLNNIEEEEKPKAHIINGNIFEHNSTSGTPITYKAPPVAPPKPQWPPQSPQENWRRSQSPTGMDVSSVWPPKRSTVTELPRTGFDPNAVRGQGTGRRCVWPPPSDEMRSGCNTPQSPVVGRKIQWNPSPSPPLTRRAAHSPARRKDIQWPPQSPTLSNGDKENFPRQSPRLARKARFDDYVKEHASINVPQTYRPPPGTQHVEFY